MNTCRFDNVTLAMRYRYFIVLLCCHLYMVMYSQEHVFDSLQNIIRTEIQSGTYRFAEAAVIYDSLARLANDTLKMGKGRNFQGMHFYFMGSHGQAIQKYLDALQCFDAVQDTFFIALVNNNIAAAYEYRHDPLSSIVHYQKALTWFRQINDSLWIANVFNNIGIQYNVAEMHNRALPYFDSAMTFYTVLKDTGMVATCIANVAECYRFLGDTDKAIELGERYLNEYKGYHTPDVLGNLYAMLGRAYFVRNAFDLASLYNLKSLEIRDQYGFIFQKSNNYEVQSMIHERRQEYSKALEYYKLFKSHQDSMFNMQKDDRITQLMTEYDVEKKDQQISLLAAQNEVNALKIDKANRQRVSYGLGALTLLISALALVFLLRLKSRTNSQLSEKNLVISQALKEKDILLREIHHRVKNNLQMISALLYLHGKSVDDLSAQEALLESQNRVQSMAMIHQNLYQDENLLGVGVKAYLEKLLGHLISSYNIEKDRITIRKRIEIDHLDVDTIVPLALIINELISNALKYAFQDGRHGEIDICIAHEEKGIIVEVSDNGPGFPEGFRSAESQNFGYKLIHILGERLGARLSVTGTNGASVRLLIPDKIAA